MKNLIRLHEELGKLIAESSLGNNEFCELRSELRKELVEKGEVLRKESARRWDLKELLNESRDFEERDKMELNALIEEVAELRKQFA